MAIPTYERLMLPILKYAGDEKEHRVVEIIDHIYKTSNLRDEQKEQLLPSGREAILRNRIRWARFYLEKAGLLESSKRGFSKITQRGHEVLEENPAEINVKFLERFSEFRKFKTPRKEGRTKTTSKKETHDKSISLESLNPTELLENACQELRNTMAIELLDEVRKSTPRFFEELVVELLLRMGYGGSRMDAGKAIGQSGDEGIDGIIKEDKLGLDTIYLQAKNWQRAVGRPEIHRFIGALKGQGANRGIFITTSTFTKEATTCASKIDSPKIVLIDGNKLAELMYDHDVGVSREATYEVKRMDKDFFSGD
jgi:restriction system protein